MSKSEKVAYIVLWSSSSLTIMGADMRPVADVYQNRFLENWQEITKIRKPIIAAVSGYAVNILRLLVHHPSIPSALTYKRYHFPSLFPPCSSVEAASSP